MKETLYARASRDAAVREVPDIIIKTLDDRWVELAAPVSSGRERLREVVIRYRKEKTFFLGASWIERTYDAEEVRSASMFAVRPKSAKGICLEMMGMTYKDRCPICDGCGVPDKLIGNKKIDHFVAAGTFVDEFVVNQPLRDLMVSLGASGNDFVPVRNGPTMSLFLVAPQGRVDVLPRVIYGVSPIEMQPSDNMPVCGHSLGLNRLSEMFVDERATISPLMRTRQLSGHKMGYLFPNFEVLMSGDLFRGLLASPFKKQFKFEIVRTTPTK